MLTQHKGLAKTSSMPGKTMLINYFQVDDSWYLVDLPGYGYAKRSKKEQDKLVEMIHNYVIGRQQLLCLFVLIDSRLTPQQRDLDFIHFLGENAVPFSLVFTKSDKQSRAKTFANVTTFLKALEEEWEELPPHFITSSETREGREELLEYIYSINEEA